MNVNTTVSSFSSLIAVYLCMASGNVFAQDAATDAANTGVLPDQEVVQNDPNAGFTDSHEGSDGGIPKIGAGLKASTLGLGIDVVARISPKLNVRLNLNKLERDFDNVSISDDPSFEDATDGSLEMSNHGLLLDYHPFEGAFRLSLGLYSSSNKVHTETTGFIENAEIGDYRYDIDGEIIGNARMNGTLPYVGLGWGNTPREGFPLSVSFDMGVLLGVDASARADATGTATELGSGIVFDINDPANPEAERFQTQLQNEIDDINDDLSDVPLFPVISLGVNYRFN